MSEGRVETEPVREAVRAYAARQPQLASGPRGDVELSAVLLEDGGLV